MSMASLAALALLGQPVGEPPPDQPCPHGSTCPHLRDGMRHPVGKQVGMGLRYQMDAVGGAGYVQFLFDKQVVLPEAATLLPNPGWGISLAVGLNPMNASATEELWQGGLLHSHRFDWGPVQLGLGVVLGCGLHLAFQPDLTFQNTFGFLLLEPRVSLGFMPHPRVQVSLQGNYLLTTRMSQLQGPGVSLLVTVGKF